MRVSAITPAQTNIGRTQSGMHPNRHAACLTTTVKGVDAKLIVLAFEMGARYTALKSEYSKDLYEPYGNGTRENVIF